MSGHPFRRIDPGPICTIPAMTSSDASPGAVPTGAQLIGGGVSVGVHGTLFSGGSQSVPHLMGFNFRKV
jgi:hypothetical protein